MSSVTDKDREAAVRCHVNWDMLPEVAQAIAAAVAKLASYERQCVIRKGHEVEDVMAHGDKVLCTTELVAQLFKDRIEAEAKLADAEKHADELDRALMRLGDALHCAGTFECDDEHSTEYCFVGIQQEARAAHAARRAARDGQEGTR